MPSSHPRTIVTNDFIQVWLEDLLYNENYDITWGPYTSTGNTISFKMDKTAHLEADKGRFFRVNLGTSGTHFEPSKIYDDWDEVKVIVMRWLTQGLK